MEECQVPLYGDGDSHENAAGEKDVGDWVEEQREEGVVDPGHPVTQTMGGIGYLGLKVPSHILADSQEEEQEVKNCQSNQKVGEVGPQGLSTKH